MTNPQNAEEAKSVPVRDLRSLFEKGPTSDPPSLKAQASGRVGTLLCTDSSVDTNNGWGAQCTRKTSSKTKSSPTASESWHIEKKDDATGNSSQSRKPAIGPKPTRSLKSGQPTETVSNPGTDLSHAGAQHKLPDVDGMQAPESYNSDLPLLTSVAKTGLEVQDTQDTPEDKHQTQSSTQATSSILTSHSLAQNASEKTGPPSSSVTRDRQTAGIDSLRRQFDADDKGGAAQTSITSLTRKESGTSVKPKPLKPNKPSQLAKRPTPTIPQGKPDIPARPSATTIPSGSSVVDRTVSTRQSSDEENSKLNEIQQGCQMETPSQPRTSDRDTSVKKVVRRAAPNVPTRKRSENGPETDLDTDTKAMYLECFESIADPHSDPKIARPASVRSVWIRSRLPSNYLADIWKTVTDHEDLCKGLTLDQFTTAMKIIDAKLRVHSQFAPGTERIPPQLPQRPIES
ncbi:hypothetical protein MYAM1_000878 [Malassezia yamatoensis]|uniref:EH domain-containing protein n=1 Tax=Malassezia yamatoensis TaxID=253288 RepID=A0AAJ5YXA7_9BASI|nr:hypothetical protein MYAM1_000878 [Malassezia yamatoensis]